MGLSLEISPTSGKTRFFNYTSLAPLDQFSPKILVPLWSFSPPGNMSTIIILQSISPSSRFFWPTADFIEVLKVFFTRVIYLKVLLRVFISAHVAVLPHLRLLEAAWYGHLQC